MEGVVKVEKEREKGSGAQRPGDRKRAVVRRMGLGGLEGSAESKRAAAAILEVLAGVRTPAQAAVEIATSVPRYYQVEARALQGLLVALEPRARGPKVRPEKEIERLVAEKARLERECGRYQALARAAQRAMGLREVKKEKPVLTRDGKVRRTRREKARGLKVVKLLRRAEPLAVVEGAGSLTGPQVTGEEGHGTTAVGTGVGGPAGR